MTDTNTNRNHIIKQTKPWIRGVNLGGWLLLERFITPYFFALSTCHLNGDFRFFPHQIDAPPTSSPLYKLYDPAECTPIQPYPVDEYTLTGAFAENKDLARQYMEIHWDNFVTFQDLLHLQHAGVTHVRVPLPHWIMGEIHDDEPWVDGGWPYFIRFVSWCRQLNIQVWPDIHTAPGSQNGFDNSGQLLSGGPTCINWSSNPSNVERTLRAVHDVVTAIKKDGLDDVVTGFGILNEPFKDCDPAVVRQYNDDALDVVRGVLGQDTAVYIGDLFNSSKWDDWWTDGTKYENTFLDSHYYHIFAEEPRALSPRQHIAYVCRKNYRDTIGCCYEEEEEAEEKDLNNAAATTTTTSSTTNGRKMIPSKGISRIIGEWSAAYDTLVVALLDVVMAGIAANGTAPLFDRQLSLKRQEFLRHFVEAQMVAYEAASVGVSRGWFYWTFKMEGGAFAEWDFLRGINEGWIPKIPSPDVSSVDLYGTCDEIIFKTDDDESIVNEFPDPSTLDPNNWQGVDIDDDVVVSHGQTLLGNEEVEDVRGAHRGFRRVREHGAGIYLLVIFLGGAAAVKYFKDTKRGGYTEIENYSSMEISV